ncbi:hypothetical protein OG909_28135 [Streptomyces sp. NBC_01754]|uniref:hypothetical protein n=1 Tax=Streptomyces sp. NBC_01754 TaxID=2975930 RepID=UPI002DDBF6C4|nr:hypothetical protein [Streptomyces sp. NBC_01754]WSC95842.1 hypothetical protein OG909_28135 [Streptomyces sp. NBC_01754]
MCGACGGGRSVPRWEDVLAPPTRGVLAARASAAGRLLDSGSGLRVRAWLSAGYLVADRVGRTVHAADLDSLWRAVAERGARPAGWRPLGGARTTEFVEPYGDRDLTAAAVWCAAVARTEPAAELELTLPDPARSRVVRVTIESGTVRATALDTPEPVTRVRIDGAGAAEAAHHLRARIPHTPGTRP